VSVRLSKFVVTSYRASHNLTACLQLKSSAEEEYKIIHAAVWPGVLAALERAHITDYSIYHYPPLQLLIATFKYTGSDYEGDMRKVGEDPETQRWWAVTDGMQESFVEGAEGSGKDTLWWTVSYSIPLVEEMVSYNLNQELQEVFRFEGKA
jgi:L-rhamnose mutarotase